MNHTRSRNRSGYTLIEMLASMTAATLLLASLGATVMIATNLLDSPGEDREAWRDRDIADRIAMDLRYAIAMDESVANGFSLTKVNVTSGVKESTSYDTQTNGLTRQIDAGPAIQLDAGSSKHTFSTHIYTAPSDQDLPAVRVRSTSSASDNNVSSLTVPFPAGCEDGDLLFMAISATDTLSYSIPGWGAIRANTNSDLRMIVLIHVFNSSSPTSTVVTMNDGPTPGIAAVIVATENAGVGLASNWVDLRTGSAFAGVSSTHPDPYEPTSGIQSFHLNLQAIAADGNPWPDRTMGMASFVDAVNATCNDNSVGFVFRNGPTPALSSTPRCWQQVSGDWIQTGIRADSRGTL